MTAGTDLELPHPRQPLARRLVPGGVGRGALRVVERNTTAYRRQWYLFLTGLVEPVLYLLSIGIGVGGLVGKVPAPGGSWSTTRRSSRPG